MERELAPSPAPPRIEPDLGDISSAENDLAVTPDAAR
ncbi:hypothetical protein F4561_001117 [Lipingzhangella halophila]|uniref:Uncharacterized protein n=1 Tax=Lipingzhangella halophila TaxID=1783352 RepID=A0A7W7W0V1_9ACTN|nr:hypothetical protein [Lipingzhangella halophila]